MQKRTILFALIGFLALSAPVFAQEDDYTGMSGEQIPETSSIAYPPEMAEPVPVYTNDPNPAADLTASEPKGESESTTSQPTTAIYKPAIQQQPAPVYAPPHPSALDNDADSTENAAAPLVSGASQRLQESPAAIQNRRVKESIQDIAQKRVQELEDQRDEALSSSSQQNVQTRRTLPYNIRVEPDEPDDNDGK